MLQALLDQLALGRTVTIGPVTGMADLVNITISDGTTTVEETSCDSDAASIRHTIRRLAAQFGGA